MADSVTAPQDLSSLSLKDYAERLGSDAPSPGGGSAAALCAALGAALAEMAARINAKRKSNPDPAASSANAEKLAWLRRRFLELVTLDAAAYAKLSVHWKAKSPELPKALKEASAVPQEIAQLAAEALEIAASETGRTSSHLMSDLAEAGAVLSAALEAAELNVEVNLRAADDPGFAQAARSRMKGLFGRAEAARGLLRNAWKKSP
jgi:formiminotetrahydrofolate cyclodeaminase